MQEIFDGTDLIIESKEHYAILSKCVKGADEVLIASFGLYAGILADGRDVTEWGHKYDNLVHKFLDRLRNIKSVKILIGLPVLTYCTPDDQPKCPHCEVKHIRYLERLLHTTQHWPDFEWKVAQDLHLKFCGMFKKGVPIGGLIGSRNLTDSSWFDISFKMPPVQLQKMRVYFLDRFNECERVTSALIEKLEGDLVG